MKMTSYLPTLLKLSILSFPFFLSACNSSSNETTYRYDVTVKNTTNNQPFSPLVVFSHDANYKIWQAGKPASVGLEYLAEGGSNAQLITEVKATSYYLDHVTGSGAIGSGKMETVTISVKNNRLDRLSITAMLLNTNDAFIGLRDISLDDLKIGETKTLNALAWDAGTEKNTEVAGTIPGPADGGEGFNSSREGDVNFISIHKGVLSSDDGLTTSILDESHRFDNPVAQITIKRID
jgi:hypothetical protein